MSISPDYYKQTFPNVRTFHFLINPRRLRICLIWRRRRVRGGARGMGLTGRRRFGSSLRFVVRLRGRPRIGRILFVELNSLWSLCLESLFRLERVCGWFFWSRALSSFLARWGWLLWILRLLWLRNSRGSWNHEGLILFDLVTLDGVWFGFLCQQCEELCSPRCKRQNRLLLLKAK